MSTQPGACFLLRRYAYCKSTGAYPKCCGSAPAAARSSLKERNVSRVKFQAICKVIKALPYIHCGSNYRVIEPVHEPLELVHGRVIMNQKSGHLVPSDPIKRSTGS